MDMAPSGLTTIMDRLRWAVSPRFKAHPSLSGCWVVFMRPSLRACACAAGRAPVEPLAAEAAGRCSSCCVLLCTARCHARPAANTEAARCRSSLPQPCAAQLCTARCHAHLLPPAHPTPSCRTIISEGNVDVRTQYLVEGLFSLRKAGFEG